MCQPCLVRDFFYQKEHRKHDLATILIGLSPLQLFLITKTKKYMKLQRFATIEELKIASLKVIPNTAYQEVITLKGTQDIKVANVTRLR